MISVTGLYCGAAERGDALRYRRAGDAREAVRSGRGASPGPVVVWNVTACCNLRCAHCYSRSTSDAGKGELTHEEALALLDDLADFNVPVVLFSGGEPLLREDLPALVRHAHSLGTRTALSTNGTCIDSRVAGTLREAGLDYAGVSLDGVGRLHDEFRGRPWAFSRAMAGLRACRDAGLKTGVRFTITRGNVSEVPAIFELVEGEGIPRVCFYHLVYSGRGSELADEDTSPEATRRVVDTIIDNAARLYESGDRKEVLTVDNHADGVYIYLRMLREGSPYALRALELLTAGGGNRSGEGVGCVSWDGEVYPDQFWRNHAVGNVRETPFSRLWTSADSGLLSALRQRRRFLKGRCGRCVWQDICGGNLRARAEAAHRDIWAEDPACYLSEQEICERAF